MYLGPDDRPQPSRPVALAPVLFVEERNLEAELLADLDERFEASAELHGAWWVNRAMYDGSRGQQWGLWDRTMGYLVPGDSPRWRRRRTLNIIKSRIIQLSAKLSRHTYVTRTAAASSDINDIMGAAAGDKLCRHWDRLWKIRAVRESLSRTAMLYGAGLARVEWCQDSGTAVMQGPQGAVMDGDVDLSFPLPWEILVDDGARIVPNGRFGFEGAESVWHRQVISRSTADLLLGRLAAKIPAAYERREFVYDDALLDERGQRAGTGRSGAGPRGDLVEWAEMWRRPSRRFTDGLYAVLANGRLAHAGPLPGLDAGIVFPFVLVPYEILEGRFWPMGLVDDLVDAQRSYNETHSALEEMDRAMGYAKYVVRGGSLSEPLVTEHGQVLEFDNPMASIDILQPPRPAEGSYRNADRTLAYVDDRTGIHAPSRGESTPGVDTATETLRLTASDDERAGGFLGRLNEGQEAIYMMALQLASKRMNLPKLIQVIGAEHNVEAEYFVAADLAGCSDVHVYSDDFMPTTQAARLQYAQVLLQSVDSQGNALLTASEAQEILGMPGSAVMQRHRAVHEARAQRQAEAMLRDGVPIVAEPLIEDAQIHIEVKVRYANSVNYDVAPPQNQALLLVNIAEHRAAVAQQRLEAALTNTPPGASGKPAGPGGAQGGPAAPGSPMSGAGMGTGQPKRDFPQPARDAQAA